MLKRLSIAAASAALVLSGPAALAEAPAADVPVTTLVVIQTPPGIDRDRIEAGFKQAIPLYEKIPGLLRKYFIVNAEGFGGMYLWKNRAAADAWYTDAWRAKAKATYGSEPQLTYFDSPVQIDNTAKGQ